MLLILEKIRTYCDCFPFKFNLCSSGIFIHHLETRNRNVTEYSCAKLHLSLLSFIRIGSIVRDLRFFYKNESVNKRVILGRTLRTGRKIDKSVETRKNDYCKGTDLTRFLSLVVLFRV